MSESLPLSLRFGSPGQYRRAFLGKFDWANIMNDLTRLETNQRKIPLKDSEKFEISRQRFLKLLGKEKTFWMPTEQEYDLDVEISRIRVRQREQPLTFMRIHPRGFRSERSVPQGKEIFFYILTGSVIFNIEKRLNKHVVQGTYVKIPPNSAYSIKCPCGESPAYLIFKVNTRHTKRKQTTNTVQ